MTVESECKSGNTCGLERMVRFLLKMGVFERMDELDGVRVKERGVKDRMEKWRRKKGSACACSAVWREGGQVTARECGCVCVEYVEVALWVLSTRGERK